MTRDEYFDLQREKGNRKSDFFNYPPQEQPLIKIEDLKPFQYQMSRHEFEGLIRLNNTDPVPIHLVNLIIKFRLSINYHEKKETNKAK